MSLRSSSHSSKRDKQPEDERAGAIDAVGEASEAPTDSHSSMPPSTTPTSQATSTATGSTESPTPATEGTPRAPSESAPALRVYYLSDVAFIDAEKEGRAGSCTGECTGFSGGAGRISSQTFPNSWLMEADADGARSTTTWNAARSCQRFDGTLGLDDSSASTQVTFTLAKEGGSPVILAVVRPNQPTPVHIDLTGVGQFEVAAYVSGATVEADVVWGDLRVTCIDGGVT